MKHFTLRTALAILGLVIGSVTPLLAQPDAGVHAVFLASLVHASISAHHQYACDVDPSSCQCTFQGGTTYQCTDGQDCYACYVPTGTYSLVCQYCYQICSGPSPMGCIGGYHWNSNECAFACGN